MGPGVAYEQSYAYGKNSPLVYVDPSGLAATVGENLVSRHRQMIISTASKYGLLAELPAAILLGENDFNRGVGKVSDLFEDYTPAALQGDPRRGPANLHITDADLIKSHFSTATLDNEIESVDPTLKGLSLRDLVRRSSNNDNLNVKLLVLAMASISKEYAGAREGKPGISIEKAVLLARKTGVGQAQTLYEGRELDYNAQIANYCSNVAFYKSEVQCRKKLFVSVLDDETEPPWLKQYGPYRATGRKLLSK